MPSKLACNSNRWRTWLAALFILLAFGVLKATQQSASAADAALDIASRRELFLDEFLIEKLTGGARLVLHRPTPREVVVVHDQPWEGNTSGYVTVIQDGERYHMYYRGHQFIVKRGTLASAQAETTCYASSGDGIHWEKPQLELHEWQGSKQNNIIWLAEGVHNFTPFKDDNPNCPAEARFKAVGGLPPEGLYAFQSADGVHWKKLADKAVFVKGAFDSQNVAYWDPLRKQYSLYFRFFGSEGEYKGLRAIAVTHSPDFLVWTDPQPLKYPDSPPHQLYTNQVIPYFRAPHILVGFPTRYVARPLERHVLSIDPQELRATLASGIPRAASDVTDGLFMSSRDGVNFRRWDEAFLRPGLQQEGRWTYGDNYQSYGLIETRATFPGGPGELSFYSSEGSWRDKQALQRRYSLRMDGFASVQAPFSGGELLTRPVKFSGKRLTINYATSAGGSLRCELQDEQGQPLPGFTLADCDEHFGDTLEQTVYWKAGADVHALAGKPIRLRFVLRDADLYALQFQP